MKVEIKRDGLILRGDLELPDHKEYDIVILMHGFTGERNSDILLAVKDLLLKNGVASLRVDFNGHGQSDGLLEDMTVLNELADAKAILDYVRSLEHIKDIYILGHSQGGVIASMMAGYYPEIFKKVVLMAPAATLKDDAIKGVCMDAVYDPHDIPDKVNVRGDIIGDFYFRIAQTLPIYEISSLYKGPVLMIHGDHDTTVDVIASKRYHDIYENSTLFIQKDADHRFLAPYTQEAAQAAVDFIIEK